MSLRSTPASAVRHGLFTPTPWSERPSVSVAATPAERRLSAQVHRTESSLRDVHDELEERSRLLARTKKSIESLQGDLRRARESEAAHRETARERNDFDARRIAELQRELDTTMEKTQGEDKSKELNQRVLLDKVTELELQAERASRNAKRLEGELALAQATAETHRNESCAAARVIETQRIAIEEARSTLQDKEKTLAELENDKEQRAASIRSLVASAAELRAREKKLVLENGVLKNALREAAGKHEVAMAQAEMALRSLKKNAGAASGSESPPGVSGNSLGARLAKLQSKVGELAEREVKVLARQTQMSGEMDSLRVACDVERVRRVEAEGKLRISEENWWKQTRGEDDEIENTRAEPQATNGST